MNAVLGASNQTLSTRDITEIEALYGDTPSGSGGVLARSTAQVHQLVQAMNVFDAAEVDTGDLNTQADVSLSRDSWLATVHGTAHAA
jgi:H2-forming N5,N10-methylenetetrahydromethanopterin dehydrogenase-like enzyme